MTSWLVDPAVQAALHGWLAWLFARAAWHKGRDARAFRETLADYGLLPARAVPAAAVGLALAETAVAAALLWPGAGPGPALAGGALVALYTGAMAWAWASGRRDLDCGCGPPGHGQPIGPGLFARNALLLAALAAAAPVAGSRPLGGLDALQIGAAIAAAALVTVAAEQARSNALRPSDAESLSSLSSESPS